MFKAVTQGPLCVPFAFGSVHWLEEEALEVERKERLRIQEILGIDQLQFVPFSLDQDGASLGTHANPVDSRGCRQCSGRFNRNYECALVQCPDEPGVQLKKGLPSSTNNKRAYLSNII